MLRGSVFWGFLFWGHSFPGALVFRGANRWCIHSTVRQLHLKRGSWGGVGGRKGHNAVKCLF